MIAFFFCSALIPSLHCFRLYGSFLLLQVFHPNWTELFGVVADLPPRNPQHNALALVLDTELDLWVNWTLLSRCSVNSTLVIAGKISLSFFFSSSSIYIMRCIWGHRARKIYYRRRKKSEDLFQPSSQPVSLPTPLPRAVASGTWEKNYNKTAAKKKKCFYGKFTVSFFFLGFPFFFCLHHPYSVYEHSLIMMQLARLWLQNDTVCARRPFLRSFF